MPSSSSIATTSATLWRSAYDSTSSGLSDSPNPRRSGASTRNPAAASAGVWRRQPCEESGKPWSNTTGCPSPSSTSASLTPSPETHGTGGSLEQDAQRQQVGAPGLHQCPGRLEVDVGDGEQEGVVRVEAERAELVEAPAGHTGLLDLVGGDGLWSGDGHWPAFPVRGVLHPVKRRRRPIGCCAA